MKKQHFACNLCDTTFIRKDHLIRHLNKLRKCNAETNFECDWCSKMFTVNSSLNRHTITCQVKRHHDELQQETNIKLGELETKYEKINKIPSATSKNVISGDSNITTTQSHNPVTTKNSHNNTIINNYGSEDIAHIKIKQITFVFSKCFRSVVECVKLKHFSPHAPQNCNVCIKDLKSKYAYVFCDGNWDVVGRTRLIDEMYEDICEYIEEQMTALIDEIDEKVVILIKRFLARKDEDEIANDVKDDLCMLLFNKRSRL